MQKNIYIYIIIWTFFKNLRSFREQKRKNYHNFIIFAAKNTGKSNFVWKNLMGFLLFNEVLKKLIFFQLPITKVGFIMLILSKFQVINANLWSIYSKIFEFMVYTFICAFWKIKFFWLLRPSKKALILDSWPLSML